MFVTLYSDKIQYLNHRITEQKKMLENNYNTYFVSYFYSIRFNFMKSSSVQNLYLCVYIYMNQDSNYLKS